MMAIRIFLSMVALCVVAQGSSNSDGSNSPSLGQRQPVKWTDEERQATKAVSQEQQLTGPPNGGEMHCSTTDCTITAVGTPGFMWTDTLRAAAQPVNQSGWPHPVDHTGNVSQEQSMSCGKPHKVTLLSKSPWKYMGRILFKGIDGLNYRCSGSFIEKGLVLTAGHCCYQNEAGKKQGWHSDWEVVLQYRTNSQKSYGVKDATVSKKWQTSLDWSHDYCFLKMKSSAAGHLGWKHGYHVSHLSSISSYGYAENYGKGEDMYSAHGYYTAKSRTGDSAAGVIKMSCNPMHSGNSGGPWRNDSHVIGLNSYHDGGDTATHEHSPYFGRDWFTSCQFVGGCKTYTRNGDVFTGPASNEEVIVV